MEGLNIFRGHPIHADLFKTLRAISLNKFQMIFPYRLIQCCIKRHKFLNAKSPKTP